MFKRDFERTPQEKANRAILSVLARLGACGYLVYVMVQLLSPPQGTPPPSQLMTIIIIVMLVLSVAVILYTIYDLIRSLKTGRFVAATYDEEHSGPVPPADTETSPELPQDTSETKDDESAED